MRLVLQRQVQLAFLFALALLLTVGLFAYRGANSLREALRWEKHTQEVLVKLNETLAEATDVETGARGFLITGSEVFLEPYQNLEQRTKENLGSLRVLVADNPKQMAEIVNLENLLDQKLAFNQSAIELRRQKGLEAASAQIGTVEGRRIMNDVRASIGGMKTEENRLLQLREDDLNASVGNTLFFLFFGIIAGVVSLGLANWAIFREVGKRVGAQDDLRELNKNLERRVEDRTRELSEKNKELGEQIKQREIAETRRRIALEAGNLGTWTFHPETGLAEIDDRSLSLFGLTGAEFDGTGEQAFSRIHAEDFPAVDRLFRTSFDEKRNFDAEFRVVLPDGAVRWNSCIGQPQFDENGEITHIVGHCRDVTDTKKRELILRESEQFNRSVFENSPDCIHVLELDGTIHSINKSGLKLMEIDDRDDYVGKQWIDFWEDEEENEQAYQAIQTASKGGTAVIEGFRRTARGQLKYWHASVSPILDADGKPSRLLSTSRDITERREAEREREVILKREQNARKDAEIANRMRDEFLATVSHELRAPLNSILGWGRLLEKGNLDETTSVKAVHTIVRNAESQNRLIEDLLDVSRIISGKLRLEVMTIKPINVVESAMETVRPAAEAKNITLEIKENPDVSHISGDPNRLQQVVWNLMSNAIKFTPTDGRVRLEIERSDDFVEIRVKDSGVGIKEEFLPHVFDRFRQADASSIRKFGGLGLGLAIVRHITEMHGGTVEVSSAGENMGSTFVVRLPLAAAPKETEEDKVKQKHDGENLDDTRKLSLDGLLILVVDDEEDTRQLLVQALTFHGATVVTANSAAEGLQAVEDKKPDILVSDIGMPDEDGYSLIRKVRALADEKNKNIPAIALTAFTRAQDRVRALTSGYQNHVAKPVEPDELATVIASLTGRLQMEE